MGTAKPLPSVLTSQSQAGACSKLRLSKGLLWLVDWLASWFSFCVLKPKLTWNSQAVLTLVAVLLPQPAECYNRLE